MPEIVNIREEIARLDALGVLKPLLADKSTGGNILWATDAYAERGTRYAPDAEITQDLITGDENAGIIQTRAQKAAEQQSARTRRRAEVYTPLWVCRAMCDNLDAVWFRRKDGFNRVDPATGRVRFPKNRTWTAYVKSTRMEITCGEGPFLTSRYDAPTGTTVPVRERVGLLDRKLRAVSENADTETDWLKWAARAFQSCYGYEFQGDSLLIARVNALMTFAEHFSERWGRFPEADKCKAIADIIAWNLWQMDGLTDAAPYRTLEKYPQMVISGWTVSQVFMPDAPKRCHIYDWRRKRETEYSSLKEKGADAMKFDFIIGNPPYQDETLGENKGFAPPIYHQFLNGCYEVSDRVELIHPARFLFNAGSTPKAWNQKMLKDPHLKVMYYEQDASKLFSNTDIKGGVAITYHDTNKNFGAIGTFTSYEDLNCILRKVYSDSFQSFSKIVFSRTSYRLTDKMHSDHPEALGQLSNGHAYDMSTNIFERLPQIFFDEKPDDGFDYIRILGREGNARVYKFVRAEYVNQVANLYKYKIYLPKANGIGVLGEVLAPPILAEAAVGATETFLSIGAFETKNEAESALKYIKTKFARALLGILKTTQDITPQKWEYVPLQDFTPGSDIDWSKPIPEIDRQLYAKYDLDEKEIAFIESHVKAME